MYRKYLHVLASLFLAYIAFRVFYDEFYRYLPEIDLLNRMNSNVGGTLAQNMGTIRDQYNHAFEKSIFYSFVTFITTFVILEYIQFVTRKRKEQNNNRMFNPDLERLQPILDEINELAGSEVNSEQKKRPTDPLDYSRFKK